jgi:hypothetical protein
VRASLIPSGQVQPEETEPVGEEIRVAMRLLAAGAPSRQVEAVWDHVLAGLAQGGASPAQRAQVLTDAGGVWIRLYERHGDVPMLDKSIVLLEEGVALAPQGSVPDALASSYLGVAYGHRFDLTREPPDLQRAVELATYSIDATAAADFRVPVYVLNLAVQSVRVFDETGSSEALEGAITVLTEAAKTRPGSPVYRSAAVLLADLYLERYSRSLRPSDLERSKAWDHLANPHA